MVPCLHVLASIDEVYIKVQGLENILCFRTGLSAELFVWNTIFYCLNDIELLKLKNATEVQIVSLII